ncbi:MAG: Rpn family recombination-promoting nuclease/putative transposase [Myxococcales bacterium]|nr:Rpn family recombination-promoting nuclease/putative transposase [Myxococcales bacterium]
MQTRAGDDVLLYILFEHQSSSDRWMPLRLLDYLVQIWNRWHASHPKAQSLPPVIPLVLYHGAECWTAPLSFAEMIEVPRFIRVDLAPWLVDFRYVLRDLGEVDDEELWGLAFGRMAMLAFKYARSRNLADQLRAKLAAISTVAAEPARV